MNSHLKWCPLDCKGRCGVSPCQRKTVNWWLRQKNVPPALVARLEAVVAAWEQKPEGVDG